MARKKQLDYRSIEEFMNPASSPFEDDILEAFANYSIDKDMVLSDLPSFYNDLGVPRDLQDYSGLAIEGTDVVDFDKLLRTAHHCIVFAQNKPAIDDTWALFTSFLDKPKDCKITLKDLQKISNSIGSNTNLVEMLAVASSKVYVTYLDMAYILGKLGLLAVP